MTIANRYGSNLRYNQKDDQDTSINVDETNSEFKILFWEKWALNLGNEDEDKLNFFELNDDPSIRAVIRNFQSKVMGEKLLFSEISTKNPSIKKWINKIRDSYPEPENEVVEDLINTFRDSLYAPSKKKYKYAVGLLLLNDVTLLLHFKKDPSLAELKNKIYPVNLILHPNNVLRTAIIENEDLKTTFSAFEQSRKWSKGHAEFWGIEPEDVSWNSLGNIFLTIQLDSFPYPIQLPIETEQLDEMVLEKRILPTGLIKIGEEEGRITNAEVFRKKMEYIDFYDFYINEKEKLEELKKKFEELIPSIAAPENPLDGFKNNKEIKYKYEEDINNLYEITPFGDSIIYKKEHPRYLILFFTKIYPGIKPSRKLIYQIYESIFNKRELEIWHAGEDTSIEPTIIGNLEIYNKIKINRDLYKFSENLLNIIQDAASIKTKKLLQVYFCLFWKNNLKNEYIKILFDYVIDSVIFDELELQFSGKGIFDKEKYLEFKSSAAVDPKPSRFAQDLIKTVEKYLKNEHITRYCILYGIEDNGDIKPLYNFKNDHATIIEHKVNNELVNKKIRINIQPIPFKEGVVLSVYISKLLK